MNTMKRINHLALILIAAISTAACNKEITEVNKTEPAQAYNGKLTVSAIA